MQVGNVAVGVLAATEAERGTDRMLRGSVKSGVLKCRAGQGTMDALDRSPRWAWYESAGQN